MITVKRCAALAAVLAISVTAAAYGSSRADSRTSGLPQGSEHVNLNPADFTTKIDNPYWPMRPGTRWVYRETDPTGSTQRVVVKVTNQKKTIANGVVARVVRDTATEDGKLLEVTDDWYAQDSKGNVWYMGEATAEYKNGKRVSTAGSFEAGVDGAEPGIAMAANPRPGMTYRQEYYKGEAEDQAAVVTVGQERVGVPFGYFAQGVLMTRDLVPLEPRVQELKLYARGIGPILAIHTDASAGRADLINYSSGK